ncbi:thiosulfate oxidation carrier protein SoxY [Parapusillimonas granuli]|uniref:Thiosulfate oxidation carrier complex protein SoxZ n=1 Tax=Parapusillimonas granuli TaxID=380911 RepID=A0A853G8G6_9BURK|nr:thiosulfate oxidation carrier protein SoxY [Parapusillimonas granuli]MBB5217287.1 sulfur-oxidizing protein SoxY [Parapusillimonas granuli]MEB2399300.1 thiosulfate oxidation carrier complex protein SoxZ [Alcaligenaceae bacterium]NYT50921.1 thiosulfate oxidation carrier complex protein SoxZ [Parapusillimonas granuli]
MTYFSAPTSELSSPLRRKAMLSALGALAFGAALPAARAQEAQKIEAIRKKIGGRPVTAEGVKLDLPLVAEDGSSVPLSIESGLAGRGGRIRSLDVYATRNPTPEVASYEFSEDAGLVKLATRIRLSESQPVVVVATTEDGRVIVAERAVRVTASGCIAPAGRGERSAEMQSRVRLPKGWKPGAPGEFLTMINHPMDTGLATDANGDTPPLRIIDAFEATLGGRVLLRAKYYRSLAANPYLRFTVSPPQGGDMRFAWTEDTGRSVEFKATL